MCFLCKAHHSLFEAGNTGEPFWSMLGTNFKQWNCPSKRKFEKKNVALNRTEKNTCFQYESWRRRLHGALFCLTENMCAGGSYTSLCVPMPGNDHDCDSTMAIDLEGTSKFSEVNSQIWNLWIMISIFNLRK